jgi:hypothetical protein
MENGTEQNAARWSVKRHLQIGGYLGLTSI